MGKEDKLYDKIGRDTGMRVPDGYFDNFASRMLANLPDYPEKPTVKPMSFWQRVKPYVYMAAMFAGIWCMMKMFHIASQNASSANLDNPPESIVLAMDDPETFEYFYETSDDESLTDYDMENAITSEYADMNDFENDFGYKFLPEYASMKNVES